MHEYLVEASVPLQLELQEAVSPMMWVLKLNSSQQMLLTTCPPLQLLK